MKIQSFCLLMATMTLFSWPACNSSDENGENCSTPIVIEELKPDRNPPGYEILIKGSGFTEDATVRFGQVEAQIRLGDTLGLIAKVPAGLLGTIELSIEEGDCIGRADFEVWSNFLPEVPASPLQIIIPLAPTYTLPTNFQNAWPNLFDDDHALFLEDEDSDGEGTLGAYSIETHNSNQILNGNPITGSVDRAGNRILIRIDRSGHNEPVEVYDGKYIALPPGVPAGSGAAILLTSRTDGRQLLIYMP